MTALPVISTLKKRRVLISGGLVTGGPQTHIPLLCSVLQQVGAEVTIAAASTGWSVEALEKLCSTGVRIVVSPFRFGPLQMLGKVWSFLAWPLLLRRDYDVLYCIGQGRMHSWAARFVRRGGFKIYHEILECPLPDSVAAQVAARMDAVLATSENVARPMTELLPGIPVRAIPSLVSAAPIDPPVERSPRAADVLRIAFLGRIVPHKRPGQLIEALPAWNARTSLAPLRLDLYGHATEAESRRLRGRIAALNLAACACFHGSYSAADLDPILAQTDLVVLPSELEGQPIVLIEAMQRGIPVVATSAGGTAELGDDNPDVLITPGTGWDAFAAGVLTMIERIRAGQIDHMRLHAWAEARYGFEPVAAAWREALLAPKTYFEAKDAVETFA